MVELQRPSTIMGITFGLVILSLLSPFIVNISLGIFGEFDLHIGTALFDFRLGRGIYFHEPVIIVQYLILLSFRPLFAYFFFRYYKGKTTVGRAILAGLFGESPFILTYLLMAPSGFLSRFVAPLPLHIFVGVVIMLMKPFDLPLVPWDEHPNYSDCS